MIAARGLDDGGQDEDQGHHQWLGEGCSRPVIAIARRVAGVDLNHVYTSSRLPVRISKN